MNILSIDGGGIRGFFSAYLLQRIQEELGVNFSNYFDLIAGTSTGSIIAAALAIGYPIEKVAELYVNKGAEIFKPQRFSMSGIWKAKYKSQNLRDQLMHILGERTLSETKTRLLIPSVDLINGQVHVFKSNYLSEFVRDNKVFIYDAVIASCSAPSYFKPHKVDGFLLADGGVWANDPALVSYVEATGKLNVPARQVRIFSVGAGVGEHYYSNKDFDKNWGAISGWGGRQIIDLILNLQSKTASNMVGLLPKGEYVRLNFSKDYRLSLDDVKILGDLKAIAERVFSENFIEIKKYFEV